MAVSDILHTVGSVAQPVGIASFVGSLVLAVTRFVFSRSVSTVQNLRIGLTRAQPLPTVVAAAHERWTDVPKTNDDRAIAALRSRADTEERSRIGQEKLVSTLFGIVVGIMVLSAIAWVVATFVKPG